MTEEHDGRIPLSVLVCDADDRTAGALRTALGAARDVVDIARANEVRTARELVAGGGFNAIFVDPLTLGLDEASTFVFAVREEQPEIVFVLYVDRAAAEQQRAAFYEGKRGRFSHYYWLDKNTPVAAFAEEVQATLEQCQADLRWRLSSATLERIRARLASDESDRGRALSAEVRNLAQFTRRPPPSTPSNPKSVFLSHHFGKEEDFRAALDAVGQLNQYVGAGDDAVGFSS